MSLYYSSSLSTSMWCALWSLLTVVTVPPITSALQLRPLDQYIEHYEPLDYPPIDTSQLHRHLKARAKRSNSVDSRYHTASAHDDRQLLPEDIRVEFRSHGRHFPLRLRPDYHTVFGTDLVIESSDGQPVAVDLSHIVSGNLLGEPRSRVFGNLRKGVFEGQILTQNDQHYYVERALKYINSSNDPILQTVSHDQSLPFHSVIYSAKHVNDPYRQKRSTVDGACALDDDVREWMNTVSSSAGDDQSTMAEGTSDSLMRNKRDNSGGGGGGNNGYSRNNFWTSFEAQGRIGPQQRPVQPVQRDIPFVPQKRACSLYIQTDTYLWDHIKKTEQSDAKAREEIASLVAQHIKAVNHIYETSVFKDIYGLKFIVQRLKINDSSACDTPTKRESNQFCSPNIDVSNFLNLNSQFNHNDFCLAYIFTYRDFSGGTLGLAWVASTSGASGGICEKYKSYTENIGGRQVQTKRSLNTGIITFVNYNSRVPPKVSELTLAHEIGHNFGSPHDYPLDCRPGGSQGNYIMYSSATSGERPNNNKFSFCSVNNISSVLHAVFNNEGKDNCFQEDNGPFCGNKLVEDGEECDCGYDMKECNERCCYPREIEAFRAREPHAKPCQRRPGCKCSPSQGPCCTENGEFETRLKQCRHESECTYESFCSGYDAVCPRPPPKPNNKTECNGGTQVCWNGECVGSICQKYDFEECFLTAKRGAKPDEMCEVACQSPNRSETCKRTSELDTMRNISGLKLRPGSPCNDFQGYCDVFQRCRAVDAEGPLARLKNLLLNQKTLMTIKQWVTTYWWACMLMLVAIMMFMAAFIKCCAVHTPSSNPKKRPALRLSDTLRRPADTLRRKSRDRSHNSGRNRESRGHHQQQPLSPTSGQSLQSAPAGSLQMQVNPHAPPTLVVALPPVSTTHLDPPPPYTGPRPTAPPLLAGPSHGYGEGRGHYNRNGQSNVPTSAKPMGANGRTSDLPMPRQSGTGGGGKHSRNSDVEMPKSSRRS